MCRQLHGIIKMDYANKRVSRLKTEIAVVFFNSVCLVYFHIRFIFFVKIDIIDCRAMRKTHLYVIGAHNPVRLVDHANQKFKTGDDSVIEVHGGVTLVITATCPDTNFAL